jgi:hypothetical protein
MVHPPHIEIPVDVGTVIRPEDLAPTGRGRTRLVPMVPIDNQGAQKLPCIWKSHKVTTGHDKHGAPIPVYACLLLAATDPPTVLPAEVAVEAWKQFSDGPVEY